jgi:NADH-quinone oxidoreductase subunit H
MALIPFWTALFRILFGINLPYGWSWALSQLTLIFIIEFALMISVALFILADRKIWAAVHKRKGPNVVGPFGLLQTFADAFKFLLKEVIVPAGANKVIFYLAPMITAILAFAGWAVIPMSNHWVVADINVGILYLFAVSSLGVYGIIMGGWASNSKYPFLGGLRSAAQMVSYEVSIGFVLITVLLFAGSLNLSDIVRAQTHGWFAFSMLFPMFVIFFISALAETNRPPFDLPEAESELVAGFFSEYSSTPFLLFFLAEYINIMLMCAMLSILFFGGWLPPVFWPLSLVPGVVTVLSAVPGMIWMILKILFFFFFFSMVKAFVPRYRYDQLMRLGWKVFLPTSLFWVALTAGWVLFFHPQGL